MSRLHKPKAGFRVRCCVAIIYPIDSLLFRIRWRHLDRMSPPRAGGVIIAVNHISNIDTLLVARLVWQSGRIPRFMVKSSLFGLPVLGTILRGAKQIPVRRGTTEAADSLHAAASALDDGEAIVIYPEGTITRDPDRWPMQAKTGIARLWLLRPDTPVVPVGQWGSQHAPAGRRTRLFSRRTAEASVGEPVDLSRFRAAEHSAERLREVTDTIMTAVRDEVATIRGERPPSTFFAQPRSSSASGDIPLVSPD